MAPADEYTVRAGSFRAPEHRTEVMRILHSIENDQQRRLMSGRRAIENGLFGCIGLRGCKGDNPLVLATRHQTVEGIQRLDMDRHIRRPCELNEIGKLFVRPEDDHSL
jgi:hypothetical protein